MKNFFDKSKIYNYITAGLFLITAVLFIKSMAYFVWNFDIFSRKQLFTFIKYIFNGKTFSSGKQLSFLITFIGACLVATSGVLIAMQLKFQKEEDVKETPESEDTEVAKENTPVNTTENTNTPVITQTQVIEEVPNKFAMYNNPQNNEIIEEKTEILPNNDMKEEEERIRLQNKIKEIMRRMKEKQEVEDEEPVKNEKTSEKLLSKVEFPQKIKAERIDMNFKNISEEENAKMERSLISAGFKLLSEIRIGSTGIDYLGVAKDKLVVVQLDTTDGNWFASEDKVEGNETPVWFSEGGNKISPVSRALEAKSDIQNILKDTIIDMPIETVACLTNSNIVNYSEYEEKWNEMGVKVVKLYEPENEESFEEMKSLSDVYPINSQEEIAEENMAKIISALEKAEIPE
ncbi:MAG: hypothetical protein K6F04_03295 [bacterium]|nr:hypothetical protein [bacterium]